MKCPHRSSWVSPHCPRNLKVKLGCHHSLASWDSEAWKCWRILSWMTFFQANCFLDPPKQIFCLAMGIPWFSPILGLKLWQKLARLLSVNTILNHPIVSKVWITMFIMFAWDVTIICRSILILHYFRSPLQHWQRCWRWWLLGHLPIRHVYQTGQTPISSWCFFSVSIPSIPGLTVWNSRLFKKCCL